ncbi:MAG: hypothetical protein ABIH23_29740, partial [bacterium]
RYPDNGVSLFNMDLIENDAAGSGFSEKGVCADVVWGKNRARKILHLDDPRAHKAWIVIYTYSETPPHNLHFKVNGYEGEITKNNRETYRWAEIPASQLKKGRNVIELSCPEAQSEEEGWSIYLARADEFEDGGGDPEHVGETSYKSIDGGRTWKQSPFGPDGKTRAEYTVRLSLDRYVKTGWLESPVIDLWKGNSSEFIVPLRMLRNIQIRIEGATPEGTGIEYYLRKGANPSPYAEDWTFYEKVCEGASLDLDIDGEDLNRRYIQFKAVLFTGNPLNTPVIKSAHVVAVLQESIPLPENIHVVQSDNPPIQYSSIDWEWETWDRPEFAELRLRENLNEVIGESRTQFGAQVKLLDHATKIWDNSDPIPEYPGWDALSILNRIDKAGSGGMCIQLNNVLGGMCMAYGWQARLVNIVSHEVCEVWNDEFAKWIYLDASSVNHYVYDIETAEPLSLLELHNRFLDKYYPDCAIDWMNDPTGGRSMDDEFSVKQGSLSLHMSPWNGLTHAAFLRMVPRNNWYEKPHPRPLTHGKTWWPWDGYINWYDERTPPKRQYSWHTDRPCDMWPDLNKVHVDATTGYGNDRLFLRFETYTPNFSHFEVNADDTGWRQTDERWVWLLQPGRNTLRVRAVSKMGVTGKPAIFVLNHANVPLGK